jgi:hypothetical protein
VLAGTPDWPMLLAADSRQPKAIPGWEQGLSSISGRPFPGGAVVTLWVLNNSEDPGFSDGRNDDGFLALRAEARLPNGIARTVELTVGK